MPDVNRFSGYLHTEGDTTCDTVLCVHGAGRDHQDWLPLLSHGSSTGLRLPQCHSIAVDLPGHGQHFGKALARVEAMADWLLNVPEVRLGRAVHLVGHSMGALVALAAAEGLSNTGRLASLSLLGCRCPMSVNQDLLEMARRAPEQAFDLIAKWSFTDGPEPTARQQQLRDKLINAAGENILAADLQACDNYGAGEHALQTLDCPVLLVSGSEDKMTPAEEAAALAKRHNHTSFKIIRGAGHALIEEAGEELAADLTQFISENMPETDQGN